ncbi:CHASE2 domain-containing protein [Desulfogranum japonicum]|uniref:CHASE2 domain-containing protein n=1 Tax=Desulfogranum japonicum TaxID=231447 RepID=UPI00041512F3|nr:CHASE2 domain-containing protein [Desulfogranum japonicum]
MGKTLLRDKQTPLWNTTVLVIGWLAGLLIATVVYLQVEPLQQLERLSYDFFLRYRSPPLDQPKDILLIDIDESSLAQYGQWPWPRYLLARMLARVNHGNPQVVGMDIIFGEHDRAALANVQQSLEKSHNVKLMLSNLPDEIVHTDLALGKELRKSPSYLGAMFLFGEDSVKNDVSVAPGLGVVVLQPSHVADLFTTASGLVAPVPLLLEAARGVGFVNVLPDTDGVLRRVPLLLRYKQELYPSLALRMACEALGENMVLVEQNMLGETSLQLGAFSLPLDEQGYFLVPFTGNGTTHETIKAKDILNGAVAPLVFTDKIVLVGSSANGLLDTHATPMDWSLPGVEVHAATIAAILHNDTIAEPGWIKSAQALFAFLAVISAVIVGLRFSTLGAASILPIGFITIPLCSFLLFVFVHVFVAPTTVLIIFVSTFILVALVRFRSEELAEQRRERDLIAARDCAIVALASLTETRDTETGGHVLRTQHYIQALAQHLAVHGPQEYRLAPQEIEMLVKSSPLHDVGKVGVRDSVLLKPGRLTEEEFEEMKMHTIYGNTALVKAEIASGIPHSASFLKTAQEISLTHHERWDGSGYPNGLEGKEIPLSGRLMAVADVYDALISKRVYKSAMSHAEAAKIIRNCAHTHFDPVIVQAFKALEHVFQDIARQFADNDAGASQPDSSNEIST